MCPTGTLAGAFRSTDGGDHFRPLPVTPLVNSAELAPVTDETAVLTGNGNAPLLRTTDGGSTWTPVAAPGNGTFWRDVDFTDSRVGVALAAGERTAALWRTTDGGATWSRVPTR